MPDGPGQFPTIKIGVETGEIKRELGPSGPATQIVMSFGEKAKAASGEIDVSLTRALNNVAKAAASIPSGTVQKFFKDTVTGGVQAVSKLIPLRSELGSVSRVLSNLGKSRDPEKIASNLNLVAVAFREIAAAASAMNAATSKRLSVAANNIDLVREQVVAQTAQRRTRPSQTQATVGPAASGAAAVAESSQAAAVRVEAMTQNLAKMVGVSDKAGKALVTMAGSSKQFTGALDESNVTKHRLEQNLAGEFLVTLANARKSVQSISEMLGGTFVSSLEKASSVYNQVFIRSFSQSMAGLEGTFKELINAFRASDAQGTKALRNLEVEHQKLARVARVAFGLSAEGARVWVQTMVQTLDPMKAITAARKAESDAQVRAGESVLKVMRDERAQLKLLSDAYAENASRTRAAQEGKADQIVAGMRQERSELEMLKDAYADNAAKTIASYEAKGNVIMSAINEERAQLKMLVDAYAENASRVRAAQESSADAIVSNMRKERSEIRMLQEAHEENAARTVASYEMRGDAVMTAINEERAQLRMLTEAHNENARVILTAQTQAAEQIIALMSRQRREIEMLTAAYAENAQRTLASLNVAARGWEAFLSSMGKSGRLADGFKASQAENAKAVAHVSAQVRQLAKDMGWSNKRAEETLRATLRLRDPIRGMAVGAYQASNAFQQLATKAGILFGAIVRLKNPMTELGKHTRMMSGEMNTAGGILTKVGMAFGALFIVDRIGQIFKGLAGTMIDLAKRGGELNASTIAYLVTAKNLKVSQEDAMEAIDRVSSGLLTQRTAISALQTGLRAGLGLEGSIKQIGEFEQAMIAMGKAGKVNEDVMKAMEFLRDRQTRGMGKATGLQLNYNQSLILARKGVGGFNKDLDAHGKRLMSVAKEAQIWSAGLSREFKIIGGVSAAVLPTLVGQLGFLDKQLQTIKDTIGKALAPIMGAFVSVINDVLRSVVKWVQANPELIRSIALATVAIGAMTVAVTTLSIAFLTLATLVAFLPGIGVFIILMNLAVVGATALSVALVGARETLLNTIGFFAALGHVVFQAGRAFVGMARIVVAAADVISKVVQVQFSMLADVSKIISTIVDTGMKLISLFIRPFGDSLNKIGETFMSIIDPVVQFGKVAYQVFLDLYTFAKDSFGPVLNVIFKTFARLDEMRTGKKVEPIIEWDKLGTPSALSQLSAAWEKLIETFRKFQGIDFGKAGEFGNEIKALVDQALNFKFELGNIQGTDFKFDEWAEGADRAGNATSRLNSVIQKIIDRLQDLQQITKDTIREAFFSDNSFISSITKFADDYGKAAREVQQAIDSSVFKFNEVKVGPPEEANLAIKKDQANRLRKDASQIIQDIRLVFEEANQQFIRRAFDEEMAGMNDIVDMRLSGEHLVRDAQARGAARQAAMEIEAVRTAMRFRLLSAQEAAEIELGIQEKLMEQILQAKSRDYQFMVDQIRTIGAIVADDLADMLNASAANAASIERQRRESDARLRAEELVNSINQTAQGEEERQQRILAVHAETQAEIRRLNQETGNFVTNLWDKIAISLRNSFIKRVVDEAIEGVVMPAVREMFDGGMTKDMLGTAQKEVERGQELMKILEPVSGLQEALKSSLDAEKMILEDILTTLTRIADDQHLQTEDIRIRQQERQRELELPPGAGEVFGPPAPPIEKTLTAFGQMQEAMVKLNAATLVALIGLESLGVRLPSSVKTTIAVMTAVTGVMTLLRSTGMVKAQAEAKETAAIVATTTALNALAASAGKAAGSIGGGSIFDMLPFGIGGGGGGSTGPLVDPIDPTMPQLAGVLGTPATSVASRLPSLTPAFDARNIDALAESLDKVQRNRMRAGTGAMSGGGIMIPIHVDSQVDGAALARDIRESVTKLAEKHAKRAIRNSTIGMGGNF